MVYGITTVVFFYNTRVLQFSSCTGSMLPYHAWRTVPVACRWITERDSVLECTGTGIPGYCNTRVQ